MHIDVDDDDDDDDDNDSNRDVFTFLSLIFRENHVFVFFLDVGSDALHERGRTMSESNAKRFTYLIYVIFIFVFILYQNVFEIKYVTWHIDVIFHKANVKISINE